MKTPGAGIRIHSTHSNLSTSHAQRKETERLDSLPLSGCISNLMEKLEVHILLAILSWLMVIF